MARYTGDLRGAQFVGADLRGAHFRESELDDVVMRGVTLSGADLDGTLDGLRINGVEIEPLVEAELARRDPARALRRATDPQDLREAWAGLTETWAATSDRVAAMPPGTVDLSVDGEWSFTQTLRHLVFVTDDWLGRAVLGRENPFHPWGLPVTERLGQAEHLGIDVDATPSYDDVLRVRAGRVESMRDFLADVSRERLAEETPGPVGQQGRPVSVLRCLHVILAEEWEHHRIAVRDLDLVEAGSPLVGRPATWREAD